MSVALFVRKSANGNQYSTNPNGDFVTVLAPSGVSSYASGSTAIINWTNTDGGAGQPDIEQSLDGVSGWTRVALLNAGTTTWQQTNLANGTYYYRIRTILNGVSSAYASPIQTVTINVAAPDTTPNPFSFIDQVDTGLATVVMSNTITVLGITAAATISIIGGEYRVNGGTWRSTAGTVNLADTVQTRHTTSANNSVTTNTILTIGGVSDTFSTTTLAAASGSWQLATGRYIPRKVPMRIVHPRPDSETNVYAAHRNAYPGMPFSTYVTIQGGSYPFRYELETAPAGMTIGAQLSVVNGVQVASTSYARINWPNPVAGTYTVKVNVYDQNFNRGSDPSPLATVTFNLVCGTSRFVFINSNPTYGSDSNTGTIDAPFLSTYKLHNGSSSTSTYNGRIVVLRGGVHDVDGMSTNGNNYAMLSGGAPVVFMGYPGESAILNLYQGQFNINSGSNDMQFKDLTIRCAGDWAAYQYMFAGYGSSNRHSWFNVTFTDFYGGSGPSGGSNANNQAVIYYSNVGCNDVSIAHCTFTGRMGCLVDTYNVRYFVFEHNRGYNLDTGAEINDSNSHCLIYLKDSVRDMSIRANGFWEGISGVEHGGLVGIGGQNNGGAAHSFNNIEYCYNKIGVFNEASIYSTYEYGSGPYGTVWGYRNSCLGDVQDWLANSTPTINLWENNVVAGGFTTMRNFTQANNLTGAGHLDSSCNLTGATRTSYLGINGAEVA